MATATVVPASVAVSLPPAVHESFWQKIQDFDHSFLAWWGKEFAKLQKDQPKIEQGLDAVAKYAVPALDIALAAAGGPAAIGATAATAIADAQTGLTVASSLVKDFGPTPTAASVYQGISDNLGSILKLDGVKNARTADAVTKVVNLAGQAAQGISAAVSAQATAPAPSTTAQ